jgi:hypothetical protein
MWFIVGVDWEVFTAAKAISATRRMIEARREMTGIVKVFSNQ